MSLWAVGSIALGGNDLCWRCWARVVVEIDAIAKGREKSLQAMYRVRSDVMMSEAAYRHMRMELAIAPGPVEEKWECSK